MSYKILRITTYYDEYLKGYYKSFPNLVNDSYLEQYEHLTSHSLELVSSFSRGFRALGIDAIDIVSNAKLLQDTWIKEHSSDHSLSSENLILEQIKFYKPDVVWIDTTQFLSKKWVEEMRVAIPSVRLLVGHICAPYNMQIAESFASFDIVFTCSPCTCKELIESGVNAILVYHSFDPEVLIKLKLEDKPFPQSDFVFTGSLLTGYGLHKSRIEYIEKFLSENMEIIIYGNLESLSTIYLKKSMHKILNLLNSIKANWLIDSIPILRKNQKYMDTPVQAYSKKLLQNTRPPVFGLDMYRVLSKANLCFNIHGEIARKCAGNVRLFEATGIGTCLLTDHKENMQDLFEIDQEVVTYKSMDECIDKAKWLVKNPLEMKKIAEAGQRRTLKDHTVGRRVDIIDRALREKLC